MDIAPKLPDILISIPWFSELNQLQRNRIEEMSIIRDVDAMETLFLEGDKEDYTYIRQRTGTARSNTPCRLLAIESVKFRELCDEDHDMGYFLMRRLANIVATRLLLTRLQLVDLLTNYPIER